jgi:hypothetical protein
MVCREDSQMQGYLLTLDKEDSCSIDEGFLTAYSQLLEQYELQKHSMLFLKDKGIPDDIVNRLKPLKWQRFVGKQEFLTAVAEHVGQDAMLRYQRPILITAHQTGHIDKAYAYIQVLKERL